MANFNGNGAPPFMEGPKGLADMLASALRGGTAQVLGLPGDLEGLGRMGVNAMGGNVNPQPALPNTESVSNWLPPMTPISNTSQKSWKPMESAGGFLPAPTLLSAPSAVRRASSMVSQLRNAPQATSAGRRSALKSIGAAGVAGATAGPEVLTQLLRAAPVAEGGVAKAAAGTAVRAAAAWSPAVVASTIKHLQDMVGGAVKAKHITPEIMADLQKNFKSVEELKNVDDWSSHWAEPFSDVKQYKDSFDTKAASEAFRRDALRMGYDDLQVGDRYIISGDPKDVERLTTKHWPQHQLTPEYVQALRARDFMASIPHEEVLAHLKTAKPGEVPKEWAKHGVRESDIVYRAMPIHAGPGNGMSDFERALYNIEVD